MSGKKKNAADRKKAMVRIICIAAAVVLVLTTLVGAILSIAL